MENSKLIIERNAEIGRECVIDFTGGLTIAEDALISEGTLVYTHDHAYDPRSIPVGQPLEIGNNAWIGARAIILPSVRFIGQRCVVGAGAVVSKDVPNDTIYVGPSGRIIRKKKKNNK
jgi:acetyltransferase-like isoleucine patch superfamily enzyme